MYVWIKGETWDTHTRESQVWQTFGQSLLSPAEGTTDWVGGGRALILERDCQVAFSAKHTSKGLVYCPILRLTLLLTVIYFQDVL